MEEATTVFADPLAIVRVCREARQQAVETVMGRLLGLFAKGDRAWFSQQRPA
jgi:hypothetical protein